MSHAPQCSLLFNKFIPSYHHHFGHQCKVADFGFTKLIELFEAIPHIVKVLFVVWFVSFWFGFIFLIFNMSTMFTVIHIIL